MKFSISVAIVLTAFFGFFVGIRQLGPSSPTQSYWAKNRSSISTYLEDAHAPVVITGSSLAVTLDFEKSNGCVYNLGLIGESALTGLDVIGESKKKPRLVFVEVNFPGRDSNHALIRQASGLFNRLFPEFNYTPPIALFADAVGGLYHSLRNGKTEENNPGGADPGPAKKELAIQQEYFDSPLPRNLLDAKILEFRLKIAQLEREGVNVQFFEMPVHPLLQNSVQAVQVREAFRRAFSDHQMIGYEELSRGVNVNPADGLHLNVEGASGVKANLKSHYLDSCS